MTNPTIMQYPEDGSAPKARRLREVANEFAIQPMVLLDLIEEHGKVELADGSMVAYQ